MEVEQKIARNSAGEDWMCVHPWPSDCGVQCGGRGIVLPSDSFNKVMGGNDPLGALKEAASNERTYTTAFFEAFPKTPSCFIRGEGKTIEEAESKAYIKFQKILKCPGHEFEPRGRRDGYGYCKHCTLSMSGVLPILNKCCKCKEPTNWTSDSRGNYYCKKHARVKPKEKSGGLFDITRKRLPRKLKKTMKEMAAVLFVEAGFNPFPMKMKGTYDLCFHSEPAKRSINFYAARREYRKRKYNVIKPSFF